MGLNLGTPAWPLVQGSSWLKPGSGLGGKGAVLLSGCKAELLLSHTCFPHPFFQTLRSGSWAPVIEPEALSVLTNWPCSTMQVITTEQAECSPSPFIKA